MVELDAKGAFTSYIFRRFGVTITEDDENFDNFFRAWKNDIIEEALSDRVKGGVIIPDIVGRDPELLT